MSKITAHIDWPFVLQFAAIVGILLIAEIAAGIAAFVYRDSIEEQFNVNAPKLLRKYDKSNGNTAATDAWDFMQTTFVSRFIL